MDRQHGHAKPLRARCMGGRLARFNSPRQYFPPRHMREFCCPLMAGGGARGGARMFARHPQGWPCDRPTLLGLQMSLRDSAANRARPMMSGAAPPGAPPSSWVARMVIGHPRDSDKEYNGDYPGPGRNSISTAPDDILPRVAPRVFIIPCLSKLDLMRSAQSTISPFSSCLLAQCFVA